MYDLWFGQDRLESHIDEKRQELLGLEQQSVALEKRLAEKQVELEGLDATLRKEKKNKQRVDRTWSEVSKEVDSKTVELQQVLRETKRLNTDLVMLKATLISASDEKQEIEDQIELYHVEIEDLEAETTVLERAIDRLLAVKAKHALETE
ncbi:MAG: hypothetical protein AAGC99_05495 [Pseudomonadota bacterium]